MAKPRWLRPPWWSTTDGTVVAVNMTPGEAASAGSSTETIVVVGTGGFEAATTVSLSDVPSVKVGQQANVLADGASTPVAGQVVSISPVPASSSSTNYRVMIGLPADAAERCHRVGDHRHRHRRSDVGRHLDRGHPHGPRARGDRGAVHHQVGLVGDT